MHSILKINKDKLQVWSVDVAKSKSMFMLMNSDGEILIDSIEVRQRDGTFA